MRQVLTMLLICLTSTFSCDNRDDIESFIKEDTNQYNDQIEEWRSQGVEWSNDPIIITRKLFNSNNHERKTVIDLESETVNHATVIITQEGLNDDSVNGEQRIIHFEKVNGFWLITKIELGFKCWDSRGHTNYSGKLCS